MAKHLAVRGLEAGIGDTHILKGVDLDVRTGEIHALMGPNGSGKSTLASVLMGSPTYQLRGGTALLDGEDLLAMGPSERALRGLFLAFQYPVEIPGVTVGKFLKRAIELRAAKPPLGDGPKTGTGMSISAYIKDLREAMDFMGMDQAFINRYLNQGFSGGEKKRMEVLQMLMLKPSIAILDETDSGLDIDALKVVGAGVNRLRGEGFGALVITHYRRILEIIVPDFVHVMYRGKVVESGGRELVEKLEEKGYDWVKERYGAEEEEDEVVVARA